MSDGVTTYNYFKAFSATDPTPTKQLDGEAGIVITNIGGTDITVGTAADTDNNVWQTYSATFVNTDLTADIGNGSIEAKWRFTPDLQNVELQVLISIGTTTNFGTQSPFTGTTPVFYVPLPPGITPNAKVIPAITGGSYDGIGVIPVITGATTGSIDMWGGLALQVASDIFWAWPSVHSPELTGAAGGLVTMFISIPV